MNIFTRVIHNSPKLRILLPSASVKHYSGAYDAPAQTTTVIINHKDVEVNMIDTCSRLGFRLMNNTFLLGPAIVLPDRVFHWHIEGDEDIHPKSLEFFFHLHPPLDLLIIGLSDYSVKRKIEKDVFMACRKHKIQVEILPTTKAVTTYNFLVGTRKVAGAFVPPIDYIFDDADVMKHKERLGVVDGRHPSAPNIMPVSIPSAPPKD